MEAEDKQEISNLGTLLKALIPFLLLLTGTAPNSPHP